MPRDLSFNGLRDSVREAADDLRDAADTEEDTVDREVIDSCITISEVAVLALIQLAQEVHQLRTSVQGRNY